MGLSERKVSGRYDRRPNRQVCGNGELFIAGYELQAALVEFQSIINQIDWATLSSTINENGCKTVRLSGPHNRLDEALHSFNLKRINLQKKIPELSSFPFETRIAIVQSCLKESETVNIKLLDMGINNTQPITKANWPEPWMDTEDYNFLGNWCGYSGDRYVETMMIVFEDGSTAIYIDPANTPTSAYLPTYYKNGNRYFRDYGSSPIRVLIHTHSTNHGVDPSPSQDDYDAKFKDVNNVSYGIYSQGTVHFY